MIASCLSRMHSRLPPAEARRSDVCDCGLLASRRLGILTTLPAGASAPARCWRLSSKSMMSLRSASATSIHSSNPGGYGGSYLRRSNTVRSTRRDAKSNKRAVGVHTNPFRHKVPSTCLKRSSKVVRHDHNAVPMSARPVPCAGRRNGGWR